MTDTGDNWAFRQQEAQVRAVLPAWKIEAHRIRTIAGGFSGAAVYCVDSQDNRRFAVRAIPRPPAAVLRRHVQIMQMLSFIHRAGLDCVALPVRRAVPRICETKSPTGGWFHEHQNRLWQIATWKKGQPAEEGGPEPHRAAAAIRTVSRFHELARDWARGQDSPFFVATRGPSPAIERRRQILRSLAGGELATLRDALPRLSFPLRESGDRLVGALQRHVPALLATTELLARESWPQQPVIRDLWAQHILFTGTRVTGLVDFWESASDHIFVDFSRLLRSWGAADNVAVSQYWQMVLDGRERTEADRRLIDVLDACTVLLSPLTWLRRLLSGDASQISHQAMDRFCALAAVAGGFRPFELELR